VTLSLPEDLEPFVSPDEFHTACVYALRLDRPDALADAWDRRFDVRPPWFEEFRDAEEAIYVGATADCLSRLEDHRDGDKRKAALLRVCEIDALRNVYTFDDADRAFEKESQIAIAMANEYPSKYIHQR